MSRVPIADEFAREVRVPVSAEAMTARPWGVGIPWSAPDARDEFAPLRGAHVCLSVAGRWRKAHEWVWERCVFCGVRA